MKFQIKEYIPYAILISIAIANVIIYVGLTRMFFNEYSGIIGDMISFFGAIIGGAITFAGVLVTIRHSDKSKELDKVPEKIERIEIAIDELKVVIDRKINYQNHIFRKYNYRYVNLNDLLVIEFNNRQKKITSDIPNQLKKLLVHVDSESYSHYLYLKKELHDSKEIFYVINEQISDFMEKHKIERRSNGEGGQYLARLEKVNEHNKTNTYIVIRKLDEINLKGLHDIVQSLESQDHIYSERIEDIYKELKTKLEYKHSELVGKLNNNV